MIRLVCLPRSLTQVGGANAAGAAAAVDAALEVGSKRRARIVKRFEGPNGAAPRREAAQRNFRVAVVRPILAPMLHAPPAPLVPLHAEAPAEVPPLADDEPDFGQMDMDVDADMGAAPMDDEPVPESPIAEDAEVEEGVANEAPKVTFAPGTGSLAALELPKPKEPRERKTKFAREAAAQRQSLAELRRSSRRRMRPLEYWRGEKKEYERKYMSLPTVANIKELEPFSPSEWAMPKSRGRTGGGGAKKVAGGAKKGAKKAKAAAAKGGVGAPGEEGVQTTPTLKAPGASGSPTPGPIGPISRTAGAAVTPVPMRG